MKSEKSNLLTFLLFVVYMLLLVSIILFKLPFYSPHISDGVRVINLIPFGGSSNENGVLILHEIILNILIFVPLGIYISLLKKGWPLRQKVLSIFCLTFALEVSQFIFALGRSDITDILGNTLGGLIGIGIYVLLLKVFRDKTNRLINVLAFAVTVCVAVGFFHLFFLSHFVMRPTAI